MARSCAIPPLPSFISSSIPMVTPFLKSLEWAVRPRNRPFPDECEVLVEDEMEYQRLRGYIRVTAEAVELCEQCEGEGSIPVEDDIVSICDACGGRIGILSTFKHGRGAEMKSTQFHLRAAS
jgi:hypothetical protein